MSDVAISITAVVLSLALGALLGYQTKETGIYVACETQKVFVIETRGVPQTFSCVRVK